MREMVGWGNHGCVVWVVRNVMNHAPTAGAWLLIKCFLWVRNVINHAPTAGAWRLTLLWLDIPGMVIEDFLAQRCGVYMGINLGRTDVFVAQHGLYGPQIGSAPQQRCGKTVAQGVRRDGLLDACFLCQTLNHNENHRAGEVATTAIEKHEIVFAGLDIEVNTVEEPQFEFLDGLRRDGYKPLFAALSFYPNELFVQVEVGKFKMGEFGNTQSATEQHFDDGLVALSFGFAQVDTTFQQIYFGRAQDLRQMRAKLWRLQQFRRIGFDMTIEEQITVERAHAAQYAGLRLGADVMVVERGREVLQIMQSGVQRVELLPRAII